MTSTEREIYRLGFNWIALCLNSLYGRLGGAIIGLYTVLVHWRKLSARSKSSMFGRVKPEVPFSHATKVKL